MTLLKKSPATVLYEEIKRQIANGNLRPGDRLRSSQELQKQFNISHRATIQALKMLEREGLIVRRAGSGTYVKELPAAAASRERGLRLKVVLSMEEAFVKAFLEPLVNGLMEQLSAMGHDPFVVESSYSEATNLFVPGSADVFIWVCPSLPPDISLPDVPLVLVAQDLRTTWPRANGYDIVTVDSEQGGACAAAYLREIGCKRVVVVGAGQEELHGVHPLSTRRLLGFEMGWGRKLPGASILWAREHSIRAGAEVFPDILKMNPMPDGIFAFSDEIAEGLCTALISHGIQPGRDVKVVGFDGQPRRSPTTPYVTSVGAPMTALGRTAAFVGVRRATDPEALSRRIALACVLYKRETA